MPRDLPSQTRAPHKAERPCCLPTGQPHRSLRKRRLSLGLSQVPRGPSRTPPPPPRGRRPAKRAGKSERDPKVAD